MNKFQVFNNTDIAKNINTLYNSATFIKDYILTEFDEPYFLFDTDALDFAQAYENLTKNIAYISKKIKGRELIKIQNIIDDIERGI